MPFAPPCSGLWPDEPPSRRRSTHSKGSTTATRAQFPPRSKSPFHRDLSSRGERDNLAEGRRRR
uniref:Uncharacterized protein n=1 Tax=Arundo donax TaxID=35708 RepID=A0A0A9GYW3_ARUDO